MIAHPEADATRTPKTDLKTLTKTYLGSENQHEYPEGGWAVWGVAVGNAWVILCALGYINSRCMLISDTIMYQSVPGQLRNSSASRYGGKVRR